MYLLVRNYKKQLVDGTVWDDKRTGIYIYLNRYSPGRLHYDVSANILHDLISTLLDGGIYIVHKELS